MKTIQLLLSGLFLVGTLLWVRTAAQRCLDGDFREWRSRLTGKDDHLSNTKDNRLFDSNQSPHGPQVETETIQSWHEVGFLTSKERENICKLSQRGVALWRQVSN